MFQYLQNISQILLYVSLNGEPGPCPRDALLFLLTVCFSLVSHPLLSLINNCLICLLKLREDHGGCVHAKSLQSCPTLCNPIDCSLPGSSIHGILQARILEWVVISFSRGIFPPRDQTCISMSPALADRFLTASTRVNKAYFLLSKK